MKQLAFLIIGLFIFIGHVKCDAAEGEGTVEAVDIDLGASREGSRTDDEVIKREEEAIKLDGLNVAQMKELREKSEKFQFQTEVNRMMKLIINSLYRNKEIFLRELISNASDALDKIRLMSLTDPNVLDTNSELNIRIKADKEGNMLHITDTGIGMTKSDLISNLGTIAKSGTAEFLSKMQDASTITDMNDMIGQFGVGFYSAFLVADKVVVTSKHNNDVQYIWESDAGAFSIVEDPRGDTLKRGTTISLQLKPEAKDFLEQDTIRNLVKKYSQFINFPIYLWASRTEQVEEVIEEEVEETEKSKPETGDEDAAVEEEEAEEDKPKTKKVDKTIWDWELLNDSKPIWTRKAAEVEDKEYDEFYKALTKDSSEPLTRVHFVAEGEVTFKALLFVPKVQPSESFNRYGTKTDNIKLYVRRVFITDEFNDMMPNYLSFIRGIVDSDDLPLNVSRETLQQHKLIKVIKKKLVRKVLDMLKKFPMSNMKNSGKNILLILIEAVDEYTISAIPEFEGKKFQNVAKEGFSLTEAEGGKKQLEQYESQFEPLTKWLSDDALKEHIAKATVSERLSDSPCALVAKINPRHPLMRELLKRVNDDPSDPTAKDMAVMLFKTATLRSGYMLKETHDFAHKEEDIPEDGIPEEEVDQEVEAENEEHDEL
ncbi:heat shock protein 90 family member [Holotrichia oblita]|uniref:Heat shock protein 90 family member n=1 Tax=Holotrichia oblita TaxID=644536 RepID=A0ACB9T3I1_HOLOL|nr:heat shock protein 90 family member [Holotrichia oblita]